MFRKAEMSDLDDIAKIYEAIHDQEEAGLVTIGWVRSIYPTRKTAQAAILQGDMFVEVDEGRVVASARLNQRQEDSYREGSWSYPAKDSEVMVMHTLTVMPSQGHRQYGKRFVDFYEKYAREHGCTALRIDTNERNQRARALYRKLGFREAGIVPCEFNGIKGVRLLLLERKVEV